MKKRITSFIYVLVFSIVGLVKCSSSLQIENQQKAMRELKYFGIAISSYINDNDLAPESDFHTIIRSYFESNNIPVPSAKDPWGHDYLYFRNSKNPKEYALGCSGRDGIFLGWAQSGRYAIEDLDDFNQDIIYSNDEFTFAPEVKKSNGRHEEADLAAMDKKELLDRYFDLRIKQIEIAKVVQQLDKIEFAMRELNANVIRIELLKLEQWRFFNILDNVFSAVAPTTAIAEKIVFKDDHLDLFIATASLKDIDLVIKRLGSLACFKQIELAGKPDFIADSTEKSDALISCRYNIDNAKPDLFFGAIEKNDYQSIKFYLLNKLKGFEASRYPSWKPDEKPGKADMLRLSKEEIVGKIKNIGQQIKMAEAQEDRLVSLEKEGEEFSGYLEKLKGVLPEKTEKENIRLELFSKIRKSGVTQFSFKAFPEKANDFFIEYQLSVSAKSNYYRLGQLFNQLSNTKNILNIQEFVLSIKGMNLKNAEVNADMIISFYVYAK